LGIPSDDAVLPWDTTRTPRWFAASMIAATSLLDCGPMISFTPSPASVSKPALARSGSCPVSTMSSVTCAFFSRWLRRLTATSSAARLVLPSDDPAPVIDSNAPTRISVLDCADADSVPSANTDASATTAPSAKGRRRTRRMRLSTPSRRCAIPWSLPGIGTAFGNASETQARQAVRQRAGIGDRKKPAPVLGRLEGAGLEVAAGGEADPPGGGGRMIDAGQGPTRL